MSTYEEVVENLNKATTAFMAATNKYEINKMELMGTTMAHCALEQSIEIFSSREKVSDLSDITIRLANMYDDMKDLLSDMTYQIGQTAYWMRERSKLIQEKIKEYDES